MRDHGALVVVDAVSAAGALPLEVDAWGIDFVFSGSKAWMCPPGLLIVAAGPRHGPRTNARSSRDSSGT